MTYLYKLVSFILIISLSIDLGISYEKPPSNIYKEIGDSGPTFDQNYISNNLFDSHSGKILSTGDQVSILINKHIAGIQSEYDKKKNITIRLRIINCNRKNKIEKMIVEEELLDGLEIVNPNNLGDPTLKFNLINNKNNFKIARWTFDKQIPDIKYVEYVLISNKGGLQNLVGAMAIAEIRDHNGIEHEITATSNDLTIKINNKPPKLVNYSLDNPMLLKIGSNLFVNASFTDPENDVIRASLLLENISIGESNINLDSYGNTQFSWDLSNYTKEDQTFFLQAIDNESIAEFGPYNLKVYKFSAYESTIFSEEVLNLLTFFIKILLNLIIALLTLLAIYNYKKVIRIFQLVRHPSQIKFLIKRFKIMLKYDREIEAKKWNIRGCELYRLHKYNDAIMAFESAIDFDKNFVDALNNIGIVLSKRNFFDAIVFFDKVISIDQSYADAWYNKGMALENSFSEEAKSYINKAMLLGYKETGNISILKWK